MFIVLLKFASQKAQADQFMAAHNAWVQRGFDEGVFMLAGSLQSGMGGGILAHHTRFDALQDRVNQDPFVAHGVVQPEIILFSPAKADPRLQFLLDKTE